MILQKKYAVNAGTVINNLCNKLLIRFWKIPVFVDDRFGAPVLVYRGQHYTNVICWLFFFDSWSTLLTVKVSANNHQLNISVNYSVQSNTAY